MKLESIKWIAIIILTILLLFTCNRTNTNTKVDDIKIENKIMEKTIIKYKDSIRYKDSILFTYIPIRDSISKMNKNVLDSFYNTQTETETMNRNECDTIIQGLVTEIEIQDTIIDVLTDKTILQDTVIHNLEIMNDNFEDMLEETENELVKLNKKNKRKNVFIIVGSTVITILSVILVVT